MAEEIVYFQLQIPKNLTLKEKRCVKEELQLKYASITDEYFDQIVKKRHRDRRRENKDCNNDYTAYTSNPTAKLSDDELFFYKEGNVTYCFDYSEIGELLSFGKNPFTKQPLRSEFKQRLEQAKNSPYAKVAIEPINIAYRRILGSKHISLEDLVLKFSNKRWNWKDLSKNRNISMKFILEHPKLPWNYEGLSENYNITIDFVVKNLNKKWNWNLLSENPNIELQDILDHPDLPWSYSGISYNHNITIDFVVKNLNKKWNWKGLSINDAISLKDIEKYPNLPWSYFSLGHRHNLTLDFVVKNINKGWEWILLSQTINFKMQDINKYPNIPWSYSWMSRNPTITIDFVVKNLDKNWHWWNLSANKNIKIQDIEKYPDLPWDYNGLSFNPNMTIDFVVKNLDKKSSEDGMSYGWDWKALSANEGINMQDIEKYPDLPWDYHALSKNPNITIDFVVKNLNQPSNQPSRKKPIPRPWDWGELSRNPSITPKDILQHPKLPWKYIYISVNTFSKYNKSVSKQYLKEHKYLYAGPLAEIEYAPIRPKVPGRVNWTPQQYQEFLKERPREPREVLYDSD